MKKYLLLLLFIFYINITYAQFWEGAPVDYCSMNNSIYNPGSHNNVPYSNMWVVIRTDREWSQYEQAFLTKSITDLYPGHTILEEPTVTYNCHGYTFGILQGSERYNITWSEDLCPGGFNLVSTPQIGDIAVMRYTSSSQPDSPHSSLVYSQDTMISKWGDGPLTKHHKDDVIGIPAYTMGQAYYTYYRRINCFITGPDIIDGSGTYTFTPNLTSVPCSWSVEPAEMFQTSSGSGCTANLTYKTPITRLAPKATITFTFSYSCDNYYSVSKTIDLLIPSSTISSIVVSDGFVIDTSSTVIVTGEIRSTPEAKSIIPTGTKLVINGGKLTGTGSDMWPGIEVWGDSATYQSTINGVCGQGRLELVNGAVIENASCAVELWHPGDTTTTGGIIHADSAFFIDNTKAVHALHYTNHSSRGGAETAYKGTFYNCSFIIDENYLGPDSVFTQVDLDHVNGLVFQGCSFSIHPNASNVSSRNSAISAYNAGFTVNSYCSYNTGGPLFKVCPDEYQVPSSFTGFHDAVHCVTDGSAVRTFTVTDALFTNNDRGVFARNTGYATLLRNSFTVGSDADCAFGVYMDNVTGFCIEENTFLSNNGTRINHGIGVFNCSAYNDVYLNDFVGLDCGNVAIGINAATQVGPPIDLPMSGLTYTCNSNIDNNIDFCVLKNGETGGIQPTQGSTVKPAGNTFDGNLYHFYNDGNHVDYFYYSGNPDQIPNSLLIHGISCTSTSNVNSCKSHYGSVIKSPEEKSALERDFISAGADCDDLERLYLDCVKEEGGETCRDLLAQLAVRRHDRSRAAGDIVRSDLMDTVADLNEIRQWLGNMGEISADRTAIASYVQEGDFDHALALAATLPALYGLSGDELTEHSNYTALLNLYKALHDTQRTIDQMNDNERLLVEAIAENGFGFSKSLARAIMERLGNDPYLTYTCPSLPTGSRGTDGPTEVREQKQTDFSVVMTPNPTSSWVGIDYSLPKGCPKATLDLFNTLGVKVMTVQLEGESGSKVAMLGEIPAGVYSYSVRCGDEVLDGKLVIVR